jgi:hypothetical protein
MNTNLSRRFRKALSAIAILTLAMLTGGMSYEAIGKVSDASRLPLQGEMVDIGGYRLNTICTGIGTPTVILDSGLGEPALSWIGVQSGVERFTRACSYDRAGYGDHMIPYKDPQAIARAIQSVWAEARHR